jgi:hypothetical protein
MYSSRGNIILSLDEGNAAQKLLKSLNAAMDTSVTPADQNLYLSFINEHDPNVLILSLSL